MRPARVHADVARDGAGQLRGRVGGVEEPLRLKLGADGQVRHPRLHPDEAVGGVDLQHLPQAHGADDDAVGGGQRAPGKRGSRPARHDLDAQPVADAHRSRDLGGRARQHHGQRRAAIGGQRVAFVGAGFLGVEDHGIGGQDGGKRGDDLVLAGDDVLVWRGHGDRGHRGIPICGAASRSPVVKFFYRNRQALVCGALPNARAATNVAA